MTRQAPRPTPAELRGQPGMDEADLARGRAELEAGWGRARTAIRKASATKADADAALERAFADLDAALRG